MVRNLEELGIALQKIVTRLQSNQNLLKLLYYTGKDPLSELNLSKEQIQEEVFDKLIKIVPRVGPKETSNSIIAMRVVQGRTDSQNQEFRNVVISFEVFVPLTQWYIKNQNLRPFSIMGEIQKSLNGKVIDGLGKIQGGDFSLNFLTDEISCYEMTYQITQYD